MKPFILLLFFPALALCQTIPVEVVHTTHRSGLSRTEARQVWEAARVQIGAEVGVNLTVTSWRTKRGKVASASSHQAGYFSSEARYSTKPGVISLHLALPYRYQGKLWVGGRSTICGGYAVVMATRKKRFRGFELRHAVTALVHELGHVLGADHQDDQSVMNIGALGLLEPSGWYLGFSDNSLMEIYRCQGMRGR